MKTNEILDKFLDLKLILCFIYLQISMKLYIFLLAIYYQTIIQLKDNIQF
jgi:hypothetical protein